MNKDITIGGLVAAGFDASGSYLLTITHSGRGVFSTLTWDRIARDHSVVYPENGTAIGIGPVIGQTIPITEMDYEKGVMYLKSPDGRISLKCESDSISVQVSDA
jgi:hypothetical protein